MKQTDILFVLDNLQENMRLQEEVLASQEREHQCLNLQMEMDILEDDKQVFTLLFLWCLPQLTGNSAFVTQTRFFFLQCRSEVKCNLHNHFSELQNLHLCLKFSVEANTRHYEKDT